MAVAAKAEIAQGQAAWGDSKPQILGDSGSWRQEEGHEKHGTEIWRVHEKVQKAMKWRVQVGTLTRSATFMVLSLSLCL